MAQLHEARSASPSPISNYPTDPADFDADPRISFDKLNQKFILETEDEKGAPLEFEFEHTIKRWIPVVRTCPLMLLPLEHSVYLPLALKS